MPGVPPGSAGGAGPDPAGSDTPVGSTTRLAGGWYASGVHASDWITSSIATAALLIAAASFIYSRDLRSLSVALTGVLDAFTRRSRPTAHRQG
jgi:hypothetical protein